MKRTYHLNLKDVTKAALAAFLMLAMPSQLLAKKF